MIFSFKILIFLRWIKVSPELMNTWYLSDNRTLILFTLKKGMFQERLFAIETLSKIKDETTIPYLLKVAKKDYLEIAMKALDLASSLDKMKKYTSEIEEIKQNWKVKLEKLKNRVVSSVKKDKLNKHTKMQALERLRQQLKRPIAGGKWF